MGVLAPDRDWVVVGETPTTLQKLGFISVGNHFPVFIHPQTSEEYALARQETKTSQGYRGFKVCFDETTTLEQDLFRRDLTINAMAMDDTGKVIDPFGGQKDLDNRLLRHVSPAFAEDPLRVIRVARFLARFWHLGFRVATETLQLMTQLSHSGELLTLSPERVWLETQKALNTKDPVVFFDLLKKCHALPVLFPELSNLIGVPQTLKYHPEGDVWVHTRMVLEKATQLSEESSVRFAALVHDLGKGTTLSERLPHHHGHEERGALLVIQLCQRLRVSNRLCQLAVLVARYHLHVHRLFEMTPKKIVRLLLHLDAFRQPEKMENFLLACRADALGRGEGEHHPYRQADLLRDCLKQCKKIDVQSLIGLGLEGKKLGDALHKKRIFQVKTTLELFKNTSCE